MSGARSKQDGGPSLSLEHVDSDSDLDLLDGHEAADITSRYASADMKVYYLMGPAL